MTSLYLNTKSAILEIVFKEYKRDEKVMELGFRKWEHQLPFDTEEDLSGLPTRLASIWEEEFGRGSEKGENLKFLLLLLVDNDNICVLGFV